VPASMVTITTARLRTTRPDKGVGVQGKEKLSLPAIFGDLVVGAGCKILLAEAFPGSDVAGLSRILTRRDGTLFERGLPVRSE
jgi:hypothetical protein